MTKAIITLTNKQRNPTSDESKRRLPGTSTRQIDKKRQLHRGYSGKPTVTVTEHTAVAHVRTSVNPSNDYSRIVNTPTDGAKLVLWTRVRMKGLYEMYQTSDGGYVVRVSNQGNDRQYALKREQAIKIIEDAKKKRVERLCNKKLMTGFSVTISDVLYDTNIDRIVDVYASDDSRMIVSYEARNGEIYLHIVEKDKEVIHRPMRTNHGT